MILSLVFVLSCLPVSQTIYCFSKCSSNTTCSTSAYTCVTCVNNVFASCAATQSGITILQSADARTMTSTQSYISTKNTAYSCSTIYNITNVFTTVIYYFVSQMVSTDYIYKNYSIPKPHYSIVLRLSMAFVGVWSSADNLRLVTFDGLLTNSFLLNYNCTSAGVNYTENLCNISRAGNHVDCIINYNFQFISNSSFLILNFSSLTFQRDPFVQFWSPFDINVAYMPCGLLCAACYGPLNSDCTACISGSVLIANNTCQASCPTSTYLLPAINDSTTGVCVSTCPQGYYLNGSINCLTCAVGCLSCLSYGYCLVYSNQSDSLSSVWNKYISLWVILIILGILLIGGLIWKYVYGRKPEADQQSQRIISQANDNNKPHEEVTVQQPEPNPEPLNNFHVQEIDFNDHVVVDRKRKRQQRDLNRVTNSVFS